MLAKFSGLNPKGPYLSLVKEKETSSIKPATEIRKFHVAVVQQRLRNVQKSVMHVESCSFANLHLLTNPQNPIRYHNALCLSPQNFA